MEKGVYAGWAAFTVMAGFALGGILVGIAISLVFVVVLMLQISTAWDRSMKKRGFTPEERQSFFLKQSLIFLLIAGAVVFAWNSTHHADLVKHPSLYGFADLTLMTLALAGYSLACLITGKRPES